MSLFVFTELPADEHLDDLGNLINIDTKNFNAELLGAEVIKEQQAINLKFSSGESTLIPEDHAQIMLTSVSLFFTFKCEVFKLLISCTFECAYITNPIF